MATNVYHLFTLVSNVISSAPCLIIVFYEPIKCLCTNVMGGLRLLQINFHSPLCIRISLGVELFHVNKTFSRLTEGLWFYSVVVRTGKTPRIGTRGSLAGEPPYVTNCRCHFKSKNTHNKHECN